MCKVIQLVSTSADCSPKHMLSGLSIHGTRPAALVIPMTVLRWRVSGCFWIPERREILRLVLLLRFPPPLGVPS